MIRSIVWNIIKKAVSLVPGLKSPPFSDPFTERMKRVKKLVTAALALLLAFSLSVPSFAESYVLESSGISFSLPASWEAKDSKMGTMFTSPGRDVMIIFGETVGEEAFDQAMEMVGDVAEEVVPDLELDDGTELDLNGIKAIEFGGSGTSDGTEVFVSVVLMAGKGESIAFMFSLGEESAMDKYESTMMDLIKSFAMEEDGSGSSSGKTKPRPQARPAPQAGGS